MIFRKAKENKMFSGLDKFLSKEAAKEAAIDAAKADLVEKLVAGLEYDKDYVIRIESPRFTPAEGGERMEMAVRVGKIDDKPESKAAEDKFEPGLDELAAMIAEAFKD